MARSAWNNAGYTMHIYAICVWCAKRQRGLGRMVYALTRVANEVRVFMELTQPRIHCIALGNNGFANLPLLPPVSLYHSSSAPSRSGSIFCFAFSSFSLAGFLRECDSFLPRLSAFLANSAFAILARRLFSFRARSPFFRRLFIFIVYRIHPAFPFSYRIENHFWRSLSSINVAGRI